MGIDVRFDEFKAMIEQQNKVLGRLTLIADALHKKVNLLSPQQELSSFEAEESTISSSQKFLKK